MALSPASRLTRNIKRFIKGRIPAQLVIQLTQRCNASCPQCGMNRDLRGERGDLSVDRVKRILYSASAKGVRAVSFTGGEPFLRFDDLIELLKYAQIVSIPYTRTGTNGFMFIRNLGYIAKTAEALSKTKLRNFWISLDSYEPAVHESMRGLPGVVAGIEKSLPILHTWGVFPSANLGINRRLIPCEGNYRNKYASDDDIEEIVRELFSEAFRKYFRFIINLGFTMASICYPMSVDESDENGLSPAYAASSSDNIVNFSEAEKAGIYMALMDVIPEFRNKIRIFTPLSSLLALYRQHSCKYPEKERYPCKGGADFFFIEARTGCAFPCGFRGKENLGPFEALDIDKIDVRPSCEKCDWECFRDPSELFGPIAGFFDSPVQTCSRMISDREYFKLWLEDLRYLKACRFFDGRIPFQTK